MRERHIAMDARTVVRPDRRGIGKSMLQLYQTLLHRRPGWRVTAFFQPGAWLREAQLRQRAMDALPPRFKPVAIDMPGDRFDAWGRVRLPLAVLRSGADVFHGPANQPCRLINQPSVVTVHDLIPLETREGLDPAHDRTFARSIRATLARAHTVTTPSHYTRNLLLHHMQAPLTDIEVIPWGPPQPMQPDNIPWVEDILHSHRIDRPYILHFGSLERRKNTRRLIEAWHALSHGMRQKHQLLIVGLDGEAQRELHHATGVDSSENAASIRLSGFVDEMTLSVLLCEAMALAYPSLSEGFGLPILEAMRAGTPVLCGDRTAVPEVAGDAACTVDVSQASSISFGLRRVLVDAVYRDDLIERGYANVERFDWQRSAEQLAGVFERCCQGRQRQAA